MTRIQVSVSAVVHLPSGVNARMRGQGSDVEITEPGARGGAGKVIVIPGDEWELMVLRIARLRSAMQSAGDLITDAAQDDDDTGEQS